MAIINILIAVDGAALASQVADGALSPGSAAAPTSLGAYSISDVYISMIAPNSYASNGSQGQSELQISANPGDTVQWAITTFGNNHNQTPYLYGSSFNPTLAISTHLTHSCFQAYTYLGPNDPPESNLKKFVNQISIVSGTIFRTGVTIQYSLSFVLVDNLDGRIIGYFQWDPFINIK